MLFAYGIPYRFNNILFFHVYYLFYIILRFVFHDQGHFAGLINVLYEFY